MIIQMYDRSQKAGYGAGFIVETNFGRTVCVQLQRALVLRNETHRKVV